MLTKKEKYTEFCINNDLPIFFQYWWLDASCGKDNWDVILSEKKGIINGVFPVFFKKIFWFKGITNPMLTPRLGIWINYPENQKYTSKLGLEKEVTNNIISQLPRNNFLALNFYYSFNNWLPFYWKGFSQTTKYSYIINDLTNLEDVFANFKSNIRNKIRKAEKVVKVEISDDLQKFYDVNKLTYKRQNKKIPYSFNKIKEIDDACIKNDSRAIFIAKDEQDNVHAALYLVYDKEFSYRY